jgi:hypothetical protein
MDSGDFQMGGLLKGRVGAEYKDTLARISTRTGGEQDESSKGQGKLLESPDHHNSTSLRICAQLP